MGDRRFCIPTKTEDFLAFSWILFSTTLYYLEKVQENTTQKCSEKNRAGRYLLDILVCLIPWNVLIKKTGNN